MKLGQLCRKIFFKDSYDLQHRLLNVMMLTGLVGILIALTFQLILQLNGTATLLMLGCLLLFVLTLWIANGLGKPQAASVLIAIVSNNILLPELFLFSGGLQSGMPLWCLGGCILSFLLLKGRKTYYVFFFNILGFVTALICSYFMPELVHPMESDFDILIDVASSMFIVAIILSSVLRYHNYINERQKKQISEAMDMAQKATKAKSDFLSTVSHDVRTPMNTIVGFTEIAKKNITNREKVTDSLEKIQLSSNHLLNLMNEILDMTKIEVGKVSIEEENTSLTELITSCCQILQNEVEDKKITIKTDYAMLDEDMVSCDKLRMNQVLINILSNAIKYSNSNSNIYISVIQLTGEDESTIETEIHIKDEGCGMTEEYKERLFTPFQRDVFGIENGISGTGLGLAITKSLVEIMNGTIEVESQEGKGTEVIVTIPFSIPTLSELEEDESLSNYNFNGYKVLLVDDNELHREIEVDLLKEVGFEVDEASEGRFAIQKHMKLGYDVILMDLVLPVMDGYQATKIIRSLDDPKLANVPVIAITANAYSDDKAKAFDSGMNAYVTKPFNKHELMEVLKLIIKEYQVNL